MNDDTDERDHAGKAEAGFERARELVGAAANADFRTSFDPEDDPEEGMHMLVLDEILYAADRDLIDSDVVVELVKNKPGDLELVLSGSHSRPEYFLDSVDLITNVHKEKHPIDAGQRARKGTEH